jgi:hypothetical protein
VQSANFTNLTGSPTTAGQCGTDPNNAGNYECTAAFQMPIGIDTVTIASWDANGATGNKLSQQVATLTMLQGVTNIFGVSLDANAAAATITATGACQSGTVGSSYGSVGTTPQTFGVTFTDADGKTIVAPGLPTIEILGNDAAYHTTSGTINGTGGTVGFTINQSAQTFVLTPSSSSITNASVNVKGVPPSSDGLTFSQTQSFTFNTGVAPPAHQFLAVTEQTGVGTGTVNFFTLGTDAGGPTSFAAYSTPTLAATTSVNQPSQSDEDDPLGLVWDNSGDLIIGNGGHDTGTGNIACVPAGAISTGADAASTVTQNVYKPASVAYEPRNGTLAAGDVGTVGTNGDVDDLSEYILNGDYVASTNNLAITGTSAGGSQQDIGGAVVNMPTLAAGTFAVTITDGCEVDTGHESCGRQGDSRVDIFGPTGSTTTIQDTTTPYAIDEPWGLTWDGTEGQLIVANNSAWHPTVSFYTTAGTLQKQITTYFNNSQTPYLVASNSAYTPATSYFAVAYATAFSSDQVQVYQNNSGTTAPTAVFNPIPYNETSDNTCSGNPSTYHYGASAIVTSLTWLSATRLMVTLRTTTTAAQGMYIYDVTTATTPTGEYDDQNCTAVGAIPNQKAFQQTGSPPLGAAYKP